MSNLGRTISYLKRNGIKNTCNTILERLDRKHLEQIQRELSGYQGVRFWADEKRRIHARHTREEQSVHRFGREYLFSILVPAYETQEEYLLQMMDSVMHQTYAKVELIIADASRSDGVQRTVDKYKKQELPVVMEENRVYHTSYGENYPKITYIRLQDNAGISANTNAALEAAGGDYIGLLDHDDALTYDALYEVMLKLEQHSYDMIYTDEDKSDGEMKHFSDPNIKSRFNLPLLLSNNYICHFTVLKAELMRELRFRPEYDGAQDYDLFLRAVTKLGCGGEAATESGQEKLDLSGLESKIAHIDKVLYHWRCHRQSTADNPESKRYAYEAGKRALQDFCRVHQMEVTVQHSMHLGFYHLQSKKNSQRPEIQAAQIPLPQSGRNRSSVWNRYPGVGAICGKVISHGQVIAGPVLDGRELFTGLRDSYSGYLNRADFPLEVDAMDERAAVFHPRYRKQFGRLEKEGKRLSFQEKMDYVRAQGDLFVYMPDFSKYLARTAEAGKRKTD